MAVRKIPVKSITEMLRMEMGVPVAFLGIL